MRISWENSGNIIENMRLCWENMVNIGYHWLIWGQYMLILCLSILRWAMVRSLGSANPMAHQNGDPGMRWVHDMAFTYTILYLC